jgi:DNA ligase-1
MLPLPNLHIQQWVSRNALYLNGKDGEMIVGAPNEEHTFNSSTSGIMRVSGEPDFKFYVFEIWNEPELTALSRWSSLQDWYAALPSAVADRVVLVTQYLVESVLDLKNFYHDALKDGYEGLILKSPFLPYKNGRSTLKGGHSLKWKEFADINCVILSVKQGKTNNNEKVRDELGKAKRSTAKAGKVFNDELGGFVVRCIEPESPYFSKTFSVGPGSLTQRNQRELFVLRESLPGMVISVKHQKSGAKTLPRFPGFKGFRSSIDTGSISD